MSIVTKGIGVVCVAGTLLALQACGRDEVMDNQNLDPEFESQPTQQNQQDQLGNQPPATPPANTPPAGQPGEPAPPPANPAPEPGTSPGI